MLGMMILWVLFAQGAWAETIYQWRDEAGAIHFTDNPASVPADKREGSARVLPSPVSKQKKKQASGRSQAASTGQDLWLNKCSSCHHLNGAGWKGDKLGLHPFVVDSSTGFPLTVDDIVRNFRYAVKGRTSNMPEIEISEDELSALAKYIVDSLQ